MIKRLTAIFILLALIGLALFAFAQYLTKNPIPTPTLIEGSSYPEIDESDFTIEVEYVPIEYEPELELVIEKPKSSRSESVVEVPQSDGPAQKYIGRCRLTIYTPTETHWGYSTATGVLSQHLTTCAVDPKLIPYGSTVIIKGNSNELRLLAVDCGNFKGKMIDIFYEGSVSDGVAYLISAFGAEYGEVWIER